MASLVTWMIRAEGGILNEIFRQESIVAIGWSDVGSLTQLENREKIKERVAQVWPDWKEGKIITSAGQLFRFRWEMKIGDGVVTYDPAQRIYQVGEISGEYRFDPTIYEDDPNVRPVRWLGQVARDQLSIDTRNSLGSTLTIFRLSEEAQTEISGLLAGRTAPAVEDAVQEVADETVLLADMQERAIEFIKDKITQLDWEAAQELVAGLLRAMGYQTQVSPPGSDRGKDIVASPDGFGFEAPRIVVEVKHRKNQMGAQEIRGFLGGRHAQDRGLYVSTGGFTKEARYEADRANIPLQLMDLDLLVKSILTHYEKFDIETQQILPLKRVFWPV